MGAMAILVDSSRCTGCKACQSACKSWNGLLPASNPFFQGNEYTHPEKLSAENWSVVSYKNPELVLTRPLWDIVHTHCMHCADAACLKSCPARAVYREDSWVIIDHKRCIGCGVCEKNMSVPCCTCRTKSGRTAFKKIKHINATAVLPSRARFLHALPHVPIMRWCMITGLS